MLSMCGKTPQRSPIQAIRRVESSKTIEPTGDSDTDPLPPP